MDIENKVVFMTKTLLFYLKLGRVCKSYPLVANPKTIISVCVQSHSSQGQKSFIHFFFQCFMLVKLNIKICVIKPEILVDLTGG